MSRIRLRVVVDEFQRRMAIKGRLGRQNNKFLSCGFSTGSTLFREYLREGTTFVEGVGDEEVENKRRLHKAKILLPLTGVDKNSAFWAIRSSQTVMRLLTERTSSIRSAGDLAAHTLLDTKVLDAILDESDPPLLPPNLTTGMHLVIKYLASTPNLHALYQQT